MTVNDFKNLKVDIQEKVAHISINRANKANSLDRSTWDAIGEAFRWADQEKAIRAIILSGEGKTFCAGIDYGMIMEIISAANGLGEGEKQEFILETIRDLQRSFTAVEKCRKPVIAAIHGSCYGGGIDLISACDIRLGTHDSKFCVKEIDLAIVADVGTLQRLPHIVGQGVTRELAFTGRTFSGDEAYRIQLLNHVYASQEVLLAEARSLALTIAQKSPLAVRGTKQVLNRCRDLSVDDGLEYVAAWNAGQLLSRDGQEAFSAMVEKRDPDFKD